MLKLDQSEMCDLQLKHVRFKYTCPVKTLLDFWVLGLKMAVEQKREVPGYVGPQVCLKYTSDFVGIRFEAEKFMIKRPIAESPLIDETILIYIKYDWDAYIARLQDLGHTCLFFISLCCLHFGSLTPSLCVCICVSLL